MDKIKIQTLIDSLTFDFPYSADDWMGNLYFENYHYHSSFSNSSLADSPSSNEEYAEKLKELGCKCIFSGEHGNQGNQFEVYVLSEKNDLKYRHSTEAYWVKDRLEKDNTNCHINIIATNSEARKELNYILSIANQDGYYYKARLDLELLLNLNPNDFIITSACVAGWKYDDAEDIWLKFYEHFGDNFFLEIQSNNTEKQKSLNKKIIEMHKKYGIGIILGLDSHYINPEDSIKRDKILEYKDVHYPEEDGWYLDFPNAKEILKRLEEQNVLTEDEMYLVLLNTNIFNSNKFEEIVFDKSFKIPSLYKDKTYEEKVKIFKSILNDNYKSEKSKSKEKLEGIKYEVEQIVDSGVVDYFLTNYHGLKKAVEEENGVLTTTSRGSMASFIVNKLLGFTTIDRFNAEIPIYPERFLTKERVQSGQMPDCDFNIAEQEPFVRAFRSLLGEHSCYPLMAIEYLKEKASWQMFASVARVEPTVANEVSKGLDSYNEKLKYLENEEDREQIDIEEYIPKQYVDFYNQSKEYQGIAINLKVHACGHLLIDGDIRREIGLISAIPKSQDDGSGSTEKRKLVACVEGKYLDDFGYVKDDFLIVDCVGLIKECWESIGENVPTFDELRELIMDDEPTWSIYDRGITCCVNQVEKESTTQKAMKYKIRNLGELSAFIAGIRPGFKSLLGNFLDRNPYTTGESKIDEILVDSFHYLIYQESIMRALSYLGLSMGETYDVIKAISKKKYAKHPEKLEELKNRLKKGWVEQIGDLNNFNNVWQVINDASRYSFNSPHSLSMGGDSAYLAYFKAHHTSKFYETAIRHYMKKEKKDKIDALLKEASNFYGYKLNKFKYGQDNRNIYVYDDTKEINQIMYGIKGMEKIAPQVMYTAHEKNINNLFGVLKVAKENKLKEPTINKLIKLNYFSEFGHLHQLQSQVKIYADLSALHEKFKTCKQLNKLDCILPIDEVAECCGKQTEKQFREIDNDKLLQVFRKNYPTILKQISAKYPYARTTTIDLMQYEVELLGYTDIKDASLPHDMYMITKLETNNWGTCFVSLYQCNSGIQKTIKFGKVKKKPIYNNDLAQGNIVIVATDFKKKGRYDENHKWIESNEYEELIISYAKIK